MLPKKKEHPAEKLQLHARNKHRARYDFNILVRSCPELKPFVTPNKYGDASIDFFNPEAVKMLNRALLQHYYNINNWDIPAGYLCPPIPGRADYIHYIADLLGSLNNTAIPIGNHIKCLDIGTGANCVYPIIGNSEYGWLFTGSDIDATAITSANKIIAENPSVQGQIEVRLQTNSNDIFKNIIKENEFYDVTICNPPFHSSETAAKAGTLRKLTNLKQQKITKPELNFGGKQHELWCIGGEEKFTENMIYQSKEFAASCLWFTTLISKSSNLHAVYKTLKKAGAADVKTIPMAQGNKVSRIVAWTFLSTQEQQNWVTARWNKKTN